MAESSKRADAVGLDRLIFFSDAVFAIAITLLALDIRLPETSPDVPAGEMLRKLVAIGPHYISYALSFVVIGLFWIAHHRMFRFISGYNSALMLLNLVFLMLIAFLPFPTTLLGGYTNWVVMVFYALMLTVAGLLADAIRLYVSAHPSLLREGVNPRDFRGSWDQYLVQPGLFVLSAVIAVWSKELTWLVWWGILALAVLDALLNQRYSGIQRS